MSEQAKRAARTDETFVSAGRWWSRFLPRRSSDGTENRVGTEAPADSAAAPVEVLRHRQLFDRAAYGLLIAERVDGCWWVVATNQTLGRLGLSLGTEPLELFASLETLGLHRALDWLRATIAAPRGGRTRCQVGFDGGSEPRTYDVTIFVLPGDSVGVRLEDVTDEAMAIELLEYQVRHDLSTGLLRPSSFVAEIAERLTWIGEPTTKGDELRPNAAALAILAITNFEAVQETFGLSFGEEYATRLAERITGLEVSATQCGRAGFRQFGLMIEGASRSAVMDQVDLLHASVAEPLVVDGTPLALGVSIGVAFYGDGVESAQDLMTRAFRACLTAERHRERIVRHDDSALTETTQRVRLTADLARGLRDDEFELRCQPKVELSTGRIRGFEVLARWVHPTLGVLLPGEFLESIQLAGLCRDFDLYIATKALGFVRRCVQIRPDIHVAVNIAPSTLSLDFVAALARRLEIYGLKGEHLLLEIVESALVTNYESVSVALTALRALDVGISIDDFGTGYSSLGRLRTMPAAEIKIDQSFARDLMRGNDDVIIRSILSLAGNLGLDCIAEGIESFECAERIAQAGCRNAQGYYFARPEPEEAAFRRLAENLVVEVPGQTK